MTPENYKVLMARLQALLRECVIGTQIKIALEREALGMEQIYVLFRMTNPRFGVLRMTPEERTRLELAMCMGWGEISNDREFVIELDVEFYRNLDWIASTLAWIIENDPIVLPARQAV